MLCHLAGSTEIEGYPGHPLRPLPELVELHERDRAARAAGEGRGDRAEHAHARRGGRAAAIADAEAETGLPADDPVRFGAGRLRTPCS